MKAMMIMKHTMTTTKSMTCPANDAVTVQLERLYSNTSFEIALGLPREQRPSGGG